MGEKIEEQLPIILLDTIFEAIRTLKGEEIIEIDLTPLNTSVCNHFVICHAQSHVQVRAIADAIEDKVLEGHTKRPYHKEGFDHAFWILLDYSDVIVHIFQEEQRRFYDLEGLWADGKIKSIR